jgi:SAM-dependent methyltransferase
MQERLLDSVSVVTHPKDARRIGRQLNDFEKRQLVEWTPRVGDFLKHDDENRTYDDVFGAYRDEEANYGTCVFPRVVFTHPYEAERVLLKPTEGRRLLELGCGSGAAAHYLAARCHIEIVCVTNSSVPADICRRKFAKFGGRVRVIVTDFDLLDLPSESFDALYALESIGYTKDVDAWLAGCWRMLKPGGRLMIRSPGSLHPAHAAVEVPTQDADIRGIGADHLAHIKGILRQLVPYGAAHQTFSVLTRLNPRSSLAEGANADRQLFRSSSAIRLTSVASTWPLWVFMMSPTRRPTCLASAMPRARMRSWTSARTAASSRPLGR